ncbi:MAG: YceD family protein [Alphaproteobacteria bacterium]
MNNPPDPGPLAWIIHPSQLTGRRQEIEIAANSRQRATLRESLDIEHIEAFKAVMTVVHGHGGAISVGGRLHAKVTRCCVVTLKNFDLQIDEEFHELFRPQPDNFPGTQALVTIDINDPGDAETYANDEIDLGKLSVEILALALDPYPRAPGAPEVLAEIDHLGSELSDAKNVTVGAQDEAPIRPSPFAVLAKKSPS